MEGLDTKEKKGMMLGERRGSYVSGSSARAIDDEPLYPDMDRFPNQGQYTIDDYYKLIPEDLQAELIDGVIYIKDTANPGHNQIAQFLGYQLQTYVMENGGPCRVFSASQDTQLKESDKRNMFEPDVQVICDRDKTDKAVRIIGAPDFVAEILSPSTKKRDMTVKLWKYQQGGVREYWIIDPKKLQVVVYEFEPDNDVAIYSFHDRIPVGIYDGDLEIDFEDIYQRVKGMYGIGDGS